MFILAVVRMASLMCLRVLLTRQLGRRSPPHPEPRRFETLPHKLRDDVGLDIWPR